MAEARRRGIPVWSELELGFRLLDNPLARGHGHEREDDDERAARRDPRRTGGRQRRPRALRAGRRSGARRLDRRRGLELPARGRAHVQTPGRRAPQPRAGPPRPARLVRRLRGRQAEAVRAAGARRRGRRSPRVRRDPRAARGAQSSTAKTSCPPSRGSPVPTTARTQPPPPSPPRAAGATDAEIARGLREFPGVAHRLEPVRERDGVRFVNDSKATNVAAALRALAAYDEPLLVILGGRAKGESFEPLAAAARGRVRRAFLVGEAAGDLAEALGRRPLRVQRRPRERRRPPRRPPRSPATWCSSRRPARATTSSATSRSAGTSSRPACVGSPPRRRRSPRGGRTDRGER